MERMTAQRPRYTSHQLTTALRFLLKRFAEEHTKAHRKQQRHEERMTSKLAGRWQAEWMEVDKDEDQPTVMAVSE